MSDDIPPLVERIHDAPGRIVLVTSGGGSRAIADLLEVAGASRTVLEACVPYCRAAVLDYLGGNPDQYCSPRTSRALAVAALLRAHRQREINAQAAPSPEADQAAPLAGVACTAGLKTDRPRRGEHRAHVAVQSDGRTTTYSLTLEKDRRTRAEEERIVARLILNALAEFVGLTERLELDLRENEPLGRKETIAPEPWRELMLGRRDAVCVGDCDEPARVVFPGAFNPTHVGHRRMAELATRLLGEPVHFEISVSNVDKPPMDYTEMERRIDEFDDDAHVWFTRAETFEAKSRLFPGATFVVGVDTLRRIAAVRYYADDPEARDAALKRIAARGCSFLVFGRDIGGTGFVRLGDLDLPEPLARICREVPAEQFREDVSSTELRRRAGRDE